jgi:AmmeMemoRadiSam system protein B
MSAAPRPPAVAGQFYSGDAAELAREVEASFLSPRGPGALPARHRRAERRIRAAVVPHAGFVYSGPIAAWVYSAIASERPPETTLILGVDHHGATRTAALSDRPWSTPLGPVDVDHELVRALAHGPVHVDEAAHAHEHSIEVQLPFLDYVLPHPRIVALMVPFRSFEFLEEVAQVVRQAVEGRDVLLVASTDFSHYVPPAEADRMDHRAIDQILAGDARGLYRTVTEYQISMCGIAPTTVLLAALGKAGAPFRLLRWGHSGEAEPMRSVVGYAGLVAEPPP